MLEAYEKLSPQWRAGLLAASVFYFKGSGDRDNGLVERARCAGIEAYSAQKGRIDRWKRRAELARIGLGKWIGNRNSSPIEGGSPQDGLPP